MWKSFIIGLRVSAVTLVLTGVAYPLVGTALAQLLFPRQAAGSLRADDLDRTVGSDLIGQRFSRSGYFHGRPSAAGDEGYDATASGGSNLGVTSKKLRERAAAELARLVAANPEASLPVPSDLVTASASGLDPDLSPEAALWQVARVARARNVTPERLRGLVESQVQERELGFLGEPRINVLALNLALDRQLGTPPP